jgi:hypothetical protein
MLLASADAADSTTRAAHLGKLQVNRAAWVCTALGHGCQLPVGLLLLWLLLLLLLLKRLLLHLLLGLLGLGLPARLHRHHPHCWPACACMLA